MEQELDRMIRGFQVSQALSVAVTLGIPELLGDGPRTSDELAAAADANPDALYRLLRALASVGVLREDAGRTFASTELGDGLRGGGYVELIGRPYYWSAWGNLLESVRTGENAFRLLHGTSVWEYRAERPQENDVFDRAMTDLTRRVDGSVLGAFDFSRFGVVVDVGGGRGALLTSILDSCPGVRGVLFDQEHVVANVAETDRLRVVSGSFFRSVPAGGDAYLMKSVIHDWEDEEAVAILRVVRAAMHDRASLLLVERDLGPPNDRPLAKLSDLNMLVMPGGRERTVDEYAQLFAAAGLLLADVTPTDAGTLILEARLDSVA